MKMFNLGTFISLLISGLLYFAVYYTVLLVKGEAIAREILTQIKKLILSELNAELENSERSRRGNLLLLSYLKEIE